MRVAEQPVKKDAHGRLYFAWKDRTPRTPPVYYGLEGTNLLAVDRDTGEVTVKNNIDREDTDTLKFYATLEDIVGGQHDNNLASEMDGDTILDLPGSSTVAALAITVRDVNDEAPTFSSPSYSVNVNENIPVGSPLPNLDIFVQDTDAGYRTQGLWASGLNLIAKLVMALRLEGSNSVFNIGLMDASGMFAVEPTIATGSTSVSIRIIKGPLDYENPNQRKFILLVVAEEAFTNPKLSSTATLTVNVQDINDNAPIFEHESYSASVVEDASPGSVVTTIAVS
ncbi:hypothetical protein IscW_ISCW018782 [Ixodes scapularis]|uniref:Cadherin domain-containing protein n=1 Tax=Ixodes scapularis TaxID=6945 RepID=B7PNV2_IXOSC|nr:hypothetical protein IscW_ISCW018782 [Ixodes scapularis]|eukprot:XP_002435444.1 hypothetical protein IscW_ISCW018782 [Ixodes scapularis]